MVIFCHQEGSQKKISYYHYPYWKSPYCEQVLFYMTIIMLWARNVGFWICILTIVSCIVGKLHQS